MPDYLPVYDNINRPFSKTASAAITGGQLLVVTGASTVGPAGAGAVNVIGVAAHDAASGSRLSIWPLANVEHEIVSAGTIAAGDGVISAAAGQIATSAVGVAAAAGTLLGIASTAGTVGQKVRFVGRG